MVAALEKLLLKMSGKMINNSDMMLLLVWCLRLSFGKDRVTNCLINKANESITSKGKKRFILLLETKQSE